MIITRLRGGIGNQMFQYAAGRAVANRINKPLKLDITYFKTHELRSYQLGCFNILEDFASVEEINRFMPRYEHLAASYYHKIRAKLLPWYRQKLIKEQKFSYDADIKKINRGVYLDGYWQSEKYFEDISDIIRYEFTLKHKPDDLNRQLLEKIENVNSISLHIRRGDYISNPLTMQTHGVLGLDYYRNALSFISKEVSDPIIFVFSDDIGWVKENLNASLPLNFIDHNKDGYDCEDLRLMSSCKHHIIANSSFSWWGAWLSGYSKKNIFVPKKWFNDPNLDTIDLIPEGWRKI